MTMQNLKRYVTMLAVLVALVMLSACEDNDSTGQTQPGAAADLNDDVDLPGCDELPSAEELRDYLIQAATDAQIGGLFGGTKEWAAIADRAGRICAVVVSTDTVTNAWPGSRGIALARANTANGFSTDTSPMSTARLYTMAQPGRSLYGAFAGNPLNPECLAVPFGSDDLAGRVCGGTIAFGGGLPIYSNGQVVGGLGLSGDTPCADHEMAKRVRELANLVPPGGNMVDNIVYPSHDSASVYAHPLCVNTWRNGIKIGEAPPADSYGASPL